MYAWRYIQYIGASKQACPDWPATFMQISMGKYVTVSGGEKCPQSPVEGPVCASIIEGVTILKELPSITDVCDMLFS